MTQKEYASEIERIETQNNTEYDLYFTIAALVKESLPIKGRLSVRAVYNRTRSKRGQIFYGLSNFPDFVILDPDFRNKENDGGKIENISQIYGCIEVKRLDTCLLDLAPIIGRVQARSKLLPNEGQLLGDILWYKKVLYTNGRDWRYYEWNAGEEEFQHIKSIVKDRIATGSSWYDKIDFGQLALNGIREMFSISDVQDANWKELNERLNQIRWK